MDSPESERFNTKENQPVQVDSFVKWQISDAREFYRAVGGDEKQAERRIGQTVTVAAAQKNSVGVRCRK